MWGQDELQSLTVAEPCSLRVAAAEAWSVVKARDIKHFESVLELLEVTYKLLPQLVTPIRHMKVMFGLKTMIIMWILKENQGMVYIITKIKRFLPRSLPLYQGCSQRDLNMMKKSHHEFKQLAERLVFENEFRKAYIREQMEEQYGEKYAQKLEQRLFHCLQQLEGALPPTTHIDQILKGERPLVKGEQLLAEVLNCGPEHVPEALRRLLLCAQIAPCTHSSPRHLSPPTYGSAQRRRAALGEWRSQTPIEPEERPSWTAPPAGQTESTGSSTSQGRWMWCGEDRTTPTPVFSVESFAEEQGSGAEQSPRRDSPPPGGQSQEMGVQSQENADTVEEHGREEVPLQLCSKHRRWVRNILEECSEEVEGQDIGILVESSEEIRGQSAIEPHQEPPLTLARPLTPPNRNPAPRPNLERGGDTAGYLERREMRRIGVRISLESQLLLIQSQILQPSVRLRRLTPAECRRAMGMGRSRTASAEREEEEEDVFAMSAPFSDCSESDSSYSEPDSEDSDPDYNPYWSRK